MRRVLCRIAFVAAASVTIIAKPEHTKQGEQYIMPGAERSARQAAAARGEKMRSKKPQLPPGGLFEAPEPLGARCSSRLMWLQSKASSA